MSKEQAKKIEVLGTNPDKIDNPPEVKGQEPNIREEETIQSEQLRAAREKATTESSEKHKILDKLKTEEETPDRTAQTMPVGKDLQTSTFQKEIRHIRRKLNPADRLASRIIHQPAIKNISEVSSKTITRPSGLLGGGITAFLGTSIYLYLTKHIGLKYNYSIFLLLLVAGFILGLIIEATVRLARSKRSL